MELAGKLASSDTSSEENDRLEQVKEETAAIKRSYECNFCRRGFTNAQALGGHMNIHRKDRAKAKQITTTSFPSKPMAVNDDYMNPRYIASISGEPTKYYPVQEAQRNYFMYYQPSVSSPGYPYGYRDSEFLLPRSQTLSTNEDQLLGVNLSLGIGHNYVEDNEVKSGILKEDELDLELRLGYNP